MCVAAIIYSKIGPSIADLRSMERVNNDGAGVAWLDPKTGTIRYERGLSAHDVRARLDDIPHRPMLIHFRYATQGKARDSLCHPFPLGINAFTTAADGNAPAVLIHNGTWSDWDDWCPSWALKSDPSDTQVAAYVAHYWEDLLEEVAWATAVMRTECSADGNTSVKVTERGRWYAVGEDRYSNLSWQYSNERWWSESYGSYRTPDHYTSRTHGGVTYTAPSHSNSSALDEYDTEGYSYVQGSDGVWRTNEDHRKWQSRHSDNLVKTIGQALAEARARSGHNGRQLSLPPARETRSQRKRRMKRERRLAKIEASKRAREADSTMRMSTAVHDACEPPWITERTRVLVSDEEELSEWDLRAEEAEALIAAGLDPDAAAVQALLREAEEADAEEAAWLAELGGSD